MRSDSGRPAASGRLGLSAACLVFAVGLVVALWAGSWAAPTGDDTRKYDVLARNVIAGNGLSASIAPPFEPSAARAPVYPLFLAAVYGTVGFSSLAVLVAQASLLAVAWVLLADTAAAIFGPTAGVVAGLLAALNPYLARTAGAVLTEALFMTLIVWFVWALVRGLTTARTAWFAAAGLLWALATLCRPATSVVLLLVFPAIWVFRPTVERRVRLAGVLLLCGVAGMVPWTARNLVQFQAFIPLQTHAWGANFWLTTLDPEEQPTGSWAGKIEEFRQRYPEFETYYRAQGPLEERASERGLVEAGLERVRQHPWRYLGDRIRRLPLLWIHSGRLWYSETSFSAALSSGRFGVVVAKLALAFVLSLAPLALACVGLWRYRHDWRRLVPILLVPASVVAVQLPMWIEERYGMPAVPFLLVLAAAALTPRDRAEAHREGSATMQSQFKALTDARVSVIIPAKNEGDVVVDVVRRALLVCDEVVVVDGQSTDGSTEKLKALGVTVVQDDGRGKGNALRRGFAVASGPIAVTMDADGSHDPDEIKALVAPIAAGESDMVIGCRMRGGSDEFSGSWAMFVRLWGNNFLTQLINMRHGTRLTDTQNGFRSMRLDLIRRIDLRENKHTIELELVLKFLKRGMRVTQIPSHEYARRAGQSTLSVVHQTPNFLWCLLRNIF